MGIRVIYIGIISIGVIYLGVMGIGVMGIGGVYKRGQKTKILLKIDVQGHCYFI